MKRVIIALALFTCASAIGQTSSQDFKTRYEKQVKMVGSAGVGVEYILDRWAEAFPDDADMLESRFMYYFAKSQTTQVLPRKEEKYLGQKPVLTLKDSTGMNVNYFQETMFDDSLFALSSTAIEKAISVRPLELGFRVDKITALISYEKDSPDMALAELLKIIDYNFSSSPKWTYYGEETDKDVFEVTIQEYCLSLYRLGMPGTLDAFRIISETMLRLSPANVQFLNNLGTYWFVVKGNNKQALKYYNKVLKLDPGNYSAAKNCVLLARKDKNTRLEKKYLPILIAVTDSETERLSCEARLKALK